MIRCVNWCIKGQRALFNELFYSKEIIIGLLKENVMIFCLFNLFAFIILKGVQYDITVTFGYLQV